MGVVTIATVVEGEGEVGALPKVLQRIAAELGVWGLRTPKPHRVPRSNLIQTGGIERAVLQESIRVKAAGGVLVLIDADKDCPARCGPELLARARTARPDLPIAVILAVPEFEAWYRAAADSLAGQAGFSETMTRPADPEGPPRDAKGWLSAHRPKSNPYSPIPDQEKLASLFDLAMARAHAPSFDKFYREVESLLLPGHASQV
jgi:Domain of unknown function (DUF4276)